MQTKHRTMTGQVVSNKMDKTVVVAVETVKRHPLYKKTFKRVTKYKAHDEENKCDPGDIVKITETRPFSREKRWRVAEVISKKEVIEVKPQEIS